jgi:DNA-binding transcriptional ArsR family regulator
MPRAVRSRETASARDARVFRALADPTRRRILQVIGAEEMRAGDVAAAFPISRPAVSRHLRILAEAGLLSVRASGRERRYAIVPGPLRDAAARIHELDAMWREGMARLGEQLAREHAPRPATDFRP